MLERSYLGQGRTLKPDIVVFNMDSQHTMAWIDVSVCHPEMPSYEKYRDSVIARRVAYKTGKYAAHLDHYNATFVPAIVDVYGGMAKELHNFIRSVSVHAAANRDFSLSTFSGFFKSALSVALQRGNALMVEESCSKALKDRINDPGFLANLGGPDFG